MVTRIQCPRSAKGVIFGEPVDASDACFTGAPRIETFSPAIVPVELFFTLVGAKLLGFTGDPV